ncbi:hypothetical protein [Mesomycoplasma ovipneumoniae]|uniref:hypothetical protein n=1 Tax=Mesomycoplasma ovipneumoniae TaxID=29562 RepID=UPI0028AA7BF0|nr:hypothetical protein [Mesomycoplasma ovipneumoniae]WNM14641.1 hypothetical protein RNM01_02740 [Mesomycoplasma ovipneumoniae]
MIVALSTFLSSISILTIFADSGWIINWFPNSTWPFPETFPSICVFVTGSLTLIAKSE